MGRLSRRSLMGVALAAPAPAVAQHMAPEAAAARRRSSAFLDVERKFGGGWRGVKRAVREAQRSGGPSATVMLGAATYRCTSTIVLDRPIRIVGQGPRGSRIKHSGAFTGPAFLATDLKRDGEWESTEGAEPVQAYDIREDDGGLELRDFAIIDDDRSVPGREGIYLMDCDDLLMDNVSFGFLTGTALKLGADDSDAKNPAVSSGRIRESDFRRVRIYRCGAGSPSGSPDVPAMVLQNGDDTGDGTNQNYFHQLRFVYNEGRMLIRGAGRDGSSLRRTIFRDMQLHALADNPSWTPVQYFPFDLVTLEGAVRETLVDGLMVNGNRTGTACFALKGHALNAETPRRLVLRNVSCVNVHGDLVRVEKGDAVAVEGTGLGSVAGQVLRALPGSGLARYYVHELGTTSPAGKVTAGTAVGTVLHTGIAV